MPRGNLPAEISSFVGRRREIAEVERLLSVARLVTLTGLGGVGKTRIALRAARNLGRTFAGGCWLVDLSELDDAALVAPAVAAALGAPDRGGTLASFLRDRELLLVLDTCERLVEAVADLAERLLRAAPRLRILTTSREALRVAGEHILVIPPLATAAGQGPAAPLPDAIRLFGIRAAAAVPGFEFTPANLRSVAALCRHLDGLPLAIEFAAGRLRGLSVQEVTERLDDRFRLLAGWHTPVPRHRTLRTAIDWSYQLCTPSERLLWARLAVFAGSFDLAAVEQVCTGGQLPAGEIADHLAALVEKSILFRVPDTDPYRFRMPETIREYGADQLRASGAHGEPGCALGAHGERLCAAGADGEHLCARDAHEEGRCSLGGHDELRRRHRDHYLRLVREAEHGWTAPTQASWFTRLTHEHANIRAALEYCLREPAEAAAGQDLAGRLWFFWVACGFLREGRHYLERALASADRPGPERCRALWACAYVAGGQGDLDTADALARQCRTGAAATGDDLLHAYAMEVQGMIAAIRGDPDAAVALLAQALRYYRRLDRLDAGTLRTLPSLGIALVMRGDADAALVPARECRALCEARGELWQRSYADYLTALALRAKGEPGTAVTHVRAAIEVKHRFHDIVGLVMCVELLAGITADAGDGERAARLLGAAQQIWQMFGLPAFGTGFHAAEQERCAQRAQALIGRSGYEASFRAGGRLGLDELVAYALDGQPVPGGGAGASPLTPREAEIAGLVAEGLSNRQIADRLMIAKRTADSHIAHILAKRGYSARTQIAAWVAAHGAVDGAPGRGAIDPAPSR